MPSKWDKYEVAPTGSKWDKYASGSVDLSGVTGGAVTQGTARPMPFGEIQSNPQTSDRAFGMAVPRPRAIASPLIAQPKETQVRNFGDIVELGATVPATISGGVQGMMFGAGLGRAGNEWIRNIGGVQDKPADQIAREASQSALLGGLFQSVGIGASKFLQKQVAPFASQVDPEMLAVSKLRGLKPMPSEMLNETTFGSNLLKESEKVTASTIGGGTVIKGVRDFNNGRIADYAKDIMDNVAPHTDPDRLAQMLQSNMEGTKNFFRQTQSSLYDKVDKAMSNLPGIETKSIKSFAQKVFGDMAPGRRELYGTAGRQPSAVMSLMETIDGLPDNIPFKDASQYVSDLKRLAGYNGTELKDPLQGSARKLASLFESSMENTAKTAGSDVYDLYRRASDFTRVGHRVFDDAVVQRIAQTEPEQLGKTLFRPETMESLRKLKATLSPGDFMRYQKGMFEQLKTKLGADSFRRVMRAGLEDMLSSTTFTAIDASAGGDKFFKGATLLKRMESFGEGTLTTAFGPDAKKSLMQFARVASRVETKEPRIGLWGIGQLFSALQSPILGTMSGRPLYGIASGGLIIASPGLLAKMITNPVGRKLLTEGYHIRPFTDKAFSFAARLASFAGSPNRGGQAEGQMPPFSSAPASSTSVSLPPFVRRPAGQ